MSSRYVCICYTVSLSTRRWPAPGDAWPCCPAGFDAASSPRRNLLSNAYFSCTELACWWDLPQLAQLSRLVAATYCLLGCGAHRNRGFGQFRYSNRRRPCELSRNYGRCIQYGSSSLWIQRGSVRMSRVSLADDAVWLANPMQGRRDINPVRPSNGIAEITLTVRYPS